MSNAAHTSAVPCGAAVAFDAAVVPFENRLKADLRWAINEASFCFEKEGLVQKTLRKITRRLDELAIPYSTVGGMALFVHEFEGITTDVDLLVTPDGLVELHQSLSGMGYLPPFSAPPEE